MGRATRWLKSLFGIKRDRERKEDSNSGDKKWLSPTHFGRDSRGLCHNPATIPPNISPAEAAWLQSFFAETDKEQNKHAVAVAAATAAAAGAVVAAAKAAVAVVRLTSHGRGTMFGGSHEKWAAVKIQTVFRAYLARKALRALKGLVKLQALVRGYLVRKQATATFHSMQALFRAQATVRSQRARGFMSTSSTETYMFGSRARRSMERFDDTRSEYSGPIHSTKLSSSFDATTNNSSNSIYGSPKIVEVDTGRPKSRCHRSNTSMSDLGDEPQLQAVSSPLPIPCRTPARLSIPNWRNLKDPDWGITGNECRFSTAHSTPRIANRDGSIPPRTPSMSVCAIDSYFRSYMTNTQSFNAKLRCHSAPKQRPEASPKKRIWLDEMMECTSQVPTQRYCSQVQEAVNFKNAVIGRLDKSAYGRYFPGW